MSIEEEVSRLRKSLARVPLVHFTVEDIPALYHLFRGGCSEEDIFRLRAAETRAKERQKEIVHLMESLKDSSF